MLLASEDIKQKQNERTNERTRAEVAARARQLKRDGKLDNTWTRDGIIFVKKGDSVHRMPTVLEIHVCS